MGWNINWFRRKNVYLASDELKCAIEDETIYGSIEKDTIFCSIQEEKFTGMVQEEVMQGYVQNGQINQNIE